MSSKCHFLRETNRKGGKMGLLSRDNIEKAVEIEKDVQQRAKAAIKELGGSLNKKRVRISDNLICFTNCNGGTGVSTLVSNLVYAETSGRAIKGGLSILVIDLNIMFPVLDIYFGDEKNDNDLYDFLTGRCNLGKAIINTGDISLMYFKHRGLTEYIGCEDEVVIVNFKEMLDKVRGLYDYVFIDCPMSLEHMLINTALYECDTIYNVWDEGVASVVNTDKMISQLMLSGISGKEKMYVILNKRTDMKYNKTLYNTLGLECIGELPYSKSVAHNSLSGKIFCKDGKSIEKNGAIYEHAVYDIAKRINEIGGYYEQ